MQIKSRLNPLREAIARFVFSTDVHTDVYERISFSPGIYRPLKPLMRRKVIPDIVNGRPIFIHVPKNGGTSIKRCLYGDDPGHLTTRFYAFSAPELLDRSDSFAIIRDPVDRFMSAFDFLIRGGGKDASVQAPVMRRLAHIRTLDDYLGYLEALQGDWFRSANTARPQWWYICDLQGRIRIKNLYLLRAHDRGVSAFLQRHGLSSVTQLNKTDRFTFEVSDLQKRRIRELYHADVSIYNLLSDTPDGGDILHGASLEELERPNIRMRASSNSSRERP
jgi:hypothetical protein